MRLSGARVDSKWRCAHDYRSVSDRECVDELTKEFIAESQEGLDRMERCLTELETRPDDSGLLGEIFRAVHTIKGVRQSSVLSEIKHGLTIILAHLIPHTSRRYQCIFLPQFLVPSITRTSLRKKYCR